MSKEPTYLTKVKDLKEVLENFNDNDLIYPAHDFVTGEKTEEYLDLVSEVIIVSPPETEDNLLGSAIRIGKTIIAF